MKRLIVTLPPAHWYAGAAVMSSCVRRREVEIPNIDGLKTCRPSKVKTYFEPTVSSTGKSSTQLECE